MKQIHHLIDAETVKSSSGRNSAVFNPATGEQTGQLDLASVQEVDAAVASSHAAFEDWQHVSIAKRTKLMFAFRNLVDANADEIARRLTSEHGKVLSDAMGEVARAIENIEFACGLAEQLKGSYSENASTGVDVYTVRRPLGVVAGITPFNFPAMVPLWMIPNAVACGNTFILKPSERDPSSPMFIVELFQEAGFPAGVLNLVNGDKVAVDRLLEHPDVKAVSFVGSTPIAKYVHETATAHGKRVQALGGAKNHMVVLPDADIDLAADSAVSAAYGSAGERCMAISVAVVVGDVADPLVDAIKVRMEKLTIGDGTDAASEMGPLITAEHRDRVAGYIAAGADAGATVVVDGRDTEFDNDGFFLGVSLLDHVTPDMTCYRDEIFGPVLTVVQGRHLSGGGRPHPGQPMGQRNGHLHPRRRRGAPVPGGRRRGHGRHQRAHPRAGGLSLVRWLEGFSVRRYDDVRTRGDPLLHETQGRHLPLARSRRQHGRSGLPP